MRDLLNIAALLVVGMFMTMLVILATLMALSCLDWAITFFCEDSMAELLSYVQLDFVVLGVILFILWRAL